MPKTNQSSNVSAPGDDDKYIQPIIGKMGWDTEYPQLYGLGYSRNNGLDFHVFASFDGLIFNKGDIDNIWNAGVSDRVKKEVDSATSQVSDAVNNASNAVNQAESAVAASKVNSDAIVAQSEAISEAKSAMDSATAKIRADVARVQNEVDTAKAANSASVEALKSDMSAAKQDIQAARQANENFAKQLDDYTKQAQAQGKTIKDIQDAQDGYTATLADVKGNVSKISDAVDGLSASLKDDQDNVATIKAKADELSATLTDHDKNIAQLTDSVKELSSTLEDAGGRLSKIEQTATALSSDVSDQQGRISKIEQKATGTEQTVANQQGQINDIKTDASGIHETLTGQGNQIANINVTLNGLNTKYEGVSGDLNKLKSSTMQDRGTVTAPDFNSLTQAGYYTVTRPHKGKNYPTVNWGTLEVSGQTSDSNGRLNQKYVSDNNAKTYVRQYNANTKSWTAWIKTANQNDVTALSNRITANSTQIIQNKQAIALKADQATVNNLSGEVSQAQAQLKVQADQISSKVTATDVNNIVDSKGYATTSTVQSLITQKAGTINESITSLDAKYNATVTQVQSLTASIDGLQSTVANKADKSQITQLTNVVQSKVSSEDYQTTISQLTDDINAKVAKGDLISQINMEAGQTLIQSKKLFLDADSVVFSGKAFIPDAAIEKLSLDKLTAGQLKIPITDQYGNEIIMGNSGINVLSAPQKFKWNSLSDLEDEAGFRLNVSAHGVEFTEHVTYNKDGKHSKPTDDFRFFKMEPGILRHGNGESDMVNTPGGLVLYVPRDISSEIGPESPGGFFGLGYDETQDQQGSEQKGIDVAYVTSGVNGWEEGLNVRTMMHMKPKGADHEMRTTWVSWSNWDGGEHYPAIVNGPFIYGGIAFPKSSKVTLFDAYGHAIWPTQNAGTYNAWR